MCFLLIEQGFECRVQPCLLRGVCSGLEWLLKLCAFWVTGRLFFLAFPCLGEVCLPSFQPWRFTALCVMETCCAHSSLSCSPALPSAFSELCRSEPDVQCGEERASSALLRLQPGGSFCPTLSKDPGWLKRSL